MATDDSKDKKRGVDGPHDFVCLEKNLHHASTGTVTYMKDLSRDEKGPLVERRTGGAALSVTRSAHDAFVDAFLPMGFPDSVSRDYLDYQLWDTAQAFCSYISGTLANQALLKGVGVGDGAATAMGATITYLMRDVTGMVGRIAFAWARGGDMDNNAKQWRIVADILNDLALTVDLVAPWFPEFFVLFVCFSSLTRAIVGVAGGATRAALTMHQARANNMGDVSAKDGSQETLVNLAAVLVGMVLLPLINENVFYTWLLFVTATICHIYCNYRAVTCLVLEQFNYERLRIATCQYIESGTVPSPAEMSVLEPILWFGSRFVSLTVGDRFGESFYSATEFKLAQVATKYAPGTKNYLLTYKPDNFFTPTSLNLMCVLHEHAETDDILRAHFHGLLVGHVFDNVKAEKERTGDLDVLFKNARELLGSKPHSGHGWGRVMKSSADYCENNFKNFVAVSKAAGWNLDRVQLTVGQYRSQWSELMEVVD